MEQLSLAIDLERCIGCKSCEAACKQTHGLGPGQYRNRVLWLGSNEGPDLDFFPLTCQQCERPICLRTCPVNPKAITKDLKTGVVRVNEERCTGCGECVVACPYSAMGFDPVEHHSVKCDLCADRREIGLRPACESVCPGYAIIFGDRADHLHYAASEGRVVRNHDHFLLGPAIVYLDRTVRDEATETQRAHQSISPNIKRYLVSAVDTRGLGGSIATDESSFPYGTEPADRKPDRVEPGGCNICFNGCSTKFHFQGDSLVRISGNEDDPALKGKICPKAQFTVQLHYNERRLTQPLKRVGKRGENRFQPVSWQQALDGITERLSSLRDQWGSESLGIFAGTRTGIITTEGYIRLFSQLWGTPNVVGTETFCAAGKDLAYASIQGAIGSGNSFTAGDIGSSNMYVYFGDNQGESRPVYFGMVNDWRIRNNAQMVVVDPRYTVTASKANRWLAIRSGTDMALGLAMCHHIFAADLYDKTFCENWVLGWERWRDFICERGYTPEWAETITSIPKEEIRQLAEEIAKADGCVIFAARGVNHHTNSVQTNRVLMYFAAITGNWGRKGGGYLNMVAATPITPDVPPERRGKVEKPLISRSPTGWTEAMRVGRPYPLRSLITCSNPLALWPDQNATREALRTLDLIVHIELFPNETSAYADYILPAATGIEKGEIGRGNDDRRIVWIDQLIDPPGEARPDGWIWIELGKRFGFDDVLKEEYKDPRVFWDEVCIDNDMLRGCTQRRLHSTPYRWVRCPVPTEDSEEIETLYLEGTTAIGQPDGKRFPTPSGKLEIWTPEIEARFQTTGLSSLPEFYSEREQLIDLPYIELQDGDVSAGVTSPFDERAVCMPRARIMQPSESYPGARLRAEGFDTELVTGRPPAPHFHSWTHYSWQAQEMWPDLYVQLHPKLAERAGISDRQRVRIETAHGSIEARAWITRGIRSSTVFVPIGWGEMQPFNPWRSVNFLTDKTQRDPLADQTNLKTLLCRVSPL